jgi:hypothetical protein
MNENNFTVESSRSKEPTSSQPGQYAIRVKGLLDPRWDWLEGLTVTYIESGDTILSGQIIDQAALHGILARIRDLNLMLLSLEQIASNNLGKEISNG